MQETLLITLQDEEKNDNYNLKKMPKYIRKTDFQIKCTKTSQFMICRLHSYLVRERTGSSGYYFLFSKLFNNICIILCFIPSGNHKYMIYERGDYSK